MHVALGLRNEAKNKTGEGLGPDVSPADILRFVGDSLRVHATLRQLVADGFAEPLLDDSGAQRYRLTPLGRELMENFLPLHHFAERWSKRAAS